MKAIMILRCFICALVFGLAFGSCASVRDGGTDDFELLAAGAGWYGKNGVPKEYITYSMSETAPLFAGKDSPALEFTVAALDVSDEGKSGLLRRVLYGGPASREYAESLFDKVKDDHLRANEAAPHDWSYSETFEGGIYSSVLVISKSLYAYTGGAHGQNEKTFFVLDTALGSQVFLNDILKSGARPSLQERIDGALRAAYNIAPGASLRTAGFLEDLNSVPENFFLSPDGLGFCWNPYEIAPYAMGTIEIVLPYPQIEDILNDRGRNLLANFD